MCGWQVGQCISYWNVFLVVQNVNQNKLSTQAIMCQRVCKIMTLNGVVLNITTNNLQSVGIEKVPSQCDYTANRAITMTFNYTSYVSPPTNVVVANNCLPVLLQTTIVHRIKQECIPVGCIRSAAVSWGEGCLPQCMLGYTPQAWAWRPPARTLNLPPWYGPGDPPPDQTPQPPLRYGPGDPPVDRMTDKCKNITFANFVCGR